MMRRHRYHQGDPDEVDEFETPALREAAGQGERRQVAGEEAAGSDSEADSQSESGLGSAEDDLEEAAWLAARQSSDDDDYNENDVDDKESDSDAPEDISQEAGQEVEQNRTKIILDTIRKEREQQKERRRKKDTLFKLQKQEKIASLKKRKLPEDLLAEMAETLKIKKTKTALSTDEVNKQGTDEEEEDLDEDVAMEHDQNLGEFSGGKDFIPLNNSHQGTHLSVVTLKKGRKEKVDRLSPADLSQFKRNMLYGRRNKRISNARVGLLIQKKRASHVQ